MRFSLLGLLVFATAHYAVAECRFEVNVGCGVEENYTTACEAPEDGMCDSMVFVEGPDAGWTGVDYVPELFAPSGSTLSYEFIEELEYLTKYCGGSGDCEYSEFENGAGNIVQVCSPPDMDGEMYEFVIQESFVPCET